MAPATTAAPITAAPPITVGAGLFCRDLYADGYWYQHAVAYWLRAGRPDRMDADRNGIPCETVYPQIEMDWFFGDTALLQRGLFCRDLWNLGNYTYEDAVAYWLLEGSPDRMDADRNGIPCETVYTRSEVDGFVDFENAVLVVPPGLLCRELDAEVAGLLSYPNAVAYWLREGHPARMDADGNGIPCETVFSSAEVAAFFAPPVSAPPGLFCRDIAGFPYWYAVGYWILAGFPARMDADGDGIPCETVYRESEVWSFVRFEQHLAG